MHPTINSERKPLEPHFLSRVMTDDSSAYKHVMENAANTSVFHALYQTTIGHPDAFFVGNYTAILGALENNPKLLFYLS